MCIVWYWKRIWDQCGNIAATTVGCLHCCVNGERLGNSREVENALLPYQADNKHLEFILCNSTGLCQDLEIYWRSSNWVNISSTNPPRKELMFWATVCLSKRSSYAGKIILGESKNCSQGGKHKPMWLKHNIWTYWACDLEVFFFLFMIPIGKANMIFFFCQDRPSPVR